MKSLIFAILLVLAPFFVNLDVVPQSADARCPNGTHKSPSGDCEKVTDNKGKPRCPNGYHRSPDGDCERVNGNNGDNDRDSPNGNNGDNGRDSSDDNAKSNDDNNNNNKDNESNVKEQEEKDDDDSIINESNDIGSNFTNTRYWDGSTDCLGFADCLSGLVTKVVDGDTIDVDNMRIRLALVNTPEIGEQGYAEAKDFAKSRCGIGTKALVDEDDVQQRGSYGRTIGLVYCGDNTVSLNQQLLESGHAKIVDNFCSESEFSNQHWAISYGCK